MNHLLKTLLAIVLLLALADTAPAAPPKMRPYAGIGLMLVPAGTTSVGASLPLYREPALVRIGELELARVPAYEWIFGASPSFKPLIVMARKGHWLRVAYDDAGREGWLTPPRQIPFQSWDQFFKGNMSRLLPGLQKKYYQAFQQPGDQSLLSLTPEQRFKVLQLEGDWAMVLIGQDTLGWLRWRDEDGRLIIGIITEPKRSS